MFNAPGLNTFGSKLNLPILAASGSNITSPLDDVVVSGGIGISISSSGGGFTKQFAKLNGLVIIVASVLGSMFNLNVLVNESAGLPSSSAFRITSIVFPPSPPASPVSGLIVKI